MRTKPFQLVKMTCLGLMSLTTALPTASAGLSVSAVAGAPTGESVLVSQPLGRRGPTSFRYFPADGTGRNLATSPNPMDPNGGKFWTRDRDLGQTFTAPATGRFHFDAVTLRVGPSPAAGGIAGALGAGVSLQIFRVDGNPVINNNGTTGNVQVSSAYDKPFSMAMADDYITGETYTTLAVARGGILPTSVTVGQNNTVGPVSDSTGTYLRWELSGTDRVVLEPGQRYGFLVMFDDPATARALPLDNWDYLNTVGTDLSLVQTGPYAAGHAIRREGSTPEPYNNLTTIFDETAAGKTAAAFSPDFETRLAQQPGTWGRPDVDTYRDLVFFLQGSPVIPEPGVLSVLALAVAWGLGRR